MKTFKYILLLISVSLLYACSKDENDLYKEERNSLLSSTQIGIYQNGKALLLFRHINTIAIPHKSSFAYRMRKGSNTQLFN